MSSQGSFHPYPSRIRTGLARFVLVAACVLVAKVRAGDPNSPVQENRPDGPTRQVDPGPNPSGDQPRPSDTEDLSRRLIDKTVTEIEEDRMAVIIRLMDEAAQRLEVDFEPGPETQAIQQRIVGDLDGAIREAAARTQKRSSSTQVARGDVRQRGERQSRTVPGPTQPGSDSGSEPSTDTGGEGSAVSSEAPKGKLEESRRAWGHLPQRTRDEILQGMEEGHIERFREWIERYYRALQESGK